jgi:glycosyltransferase involved in cell wall biosynthesis
VVDVANRRDETFRPRSDYTLVIGEKFDWGEDRHRFRAGTVHAHLATSMLHTLHNANLRRRHERLVARGRPPVALRRAYQEHLPAAWTTQALIAVGNDFTAGTWRHRFAGPIHAFDNTAVRNGAIISDPRDLETAPRHFLFLASRSQVQKGLDLLLEIFPRHPDLHLWVCSRFEEEDDFKAAYRRELFETPTVHPLGWVSVVNPEFTELLRRCAFVILPSCSEGQAGSVVHAMHSGLIPLVTRESGVDTGDHGVTFAGDGIEEIERVIVEVSRYPARVVAEQAERARRVARTRYTEDAFARRWRAIVEEITRRRE